MSLDLSITGHRTSLPQCKSRSAYRFKAANSYVDESLFSNSPGRVDTALQWSPATPSQVPRVWNPEETKDIKSNSSCKSNRTPTGTPRKQIQYRVKTRSPSYCDESLFGKKLEDCGWEAPWVKKEDTVRLRPLLWCPTPVLRPQTAKPGNNKSAVRAVHPPDASENILGAYKGQRNFWKLPDNDSDSGGVSPSVTRPGWSSSRKDSARSSSWSGRVTVRKGSGTLTERPPWK
ncbi:RBPJ-interacting and tubulin-associated protein 1 [Spea bombifrons]|uniref:RBPJ-interacting and tubulin-associated protein 1 n=1 Tax=Spea bombifrons TaxID=233779 RepID=UPI00234B813B|nr:RBPJ-interacting and tubulin-associated protein 1 [Spea bombifrons]XP_053324794.1 RBPJ-interacting and tubulin-associated protein 1 [Spea bombifrons]